MKLRFSIEWASNSFHTDCLGQSKGKIWRAHNDPTIYFVPGSTIVQTGEIVGGCQMHVLWDNPISLINLRVPQQQAHCYKWGIRLIPFMHNFGPCENGLFPHTFTIQTVRGNFFKLPRAIGSDNIGKFSGFVVINEAKQHHFGASGRHFGASRGVGNPFYLHLVEFKGLLGTWGKLRGGVGTTSYLHAK